MLKKKILQTINRLLAIILSILGISCTQHKTMYGVPMGTISFKGHVQNTEESPIPNIRVSLSRAVSTITDNKGDYHIHIREDCPPRSVQLFIEDIDGEENGLYQSDTIQVNLQYRGSTSQWDEGTAEAEVNVTLKNAPVK